VAAKAPDGVRLIVALGDDVNGMVPGTGHDRSALHNAAGFGTLAMVRFLLELGADPDLRDLTYHATPIAWARHNRQQDIVDDLMRFASIFDAVACDGVERVAILLEENPALANSRDDAGNPLVFYLHPELARLPEMIGLLTQHGADLNARSTNGKTVLDRALEHGWDNFAVLLRERGAMASSEVNAAATD
jgi:ankyrin repeat protein